MARADAPADIKAVLEASRHYVDAYGALVHGYKPARHHRIWCERMMDLVEGRSAKRKLLIVSPPGHAKSTWFSLVFPTWMLGRRPDQHYLFFTSSDEMAYQFSTTVKLTLQASPKHDLVFPDRLCRPHYDRGWSSDGLYLAGSPLSEKDPAFRAVGYGAHVIGSRCHGIILDDPLTQEKATSKLEQDKAKRYYDQTIATRLHPGGWVIAVMTRWHQGDLAAYLAEKPDWDVLAMPALGDYPWGAALWPEMFPVAVLEELRASMGGPQFSAVYLGDPTSLGGELFRDGAWFKPLPGDFDAQGQDGKTTRERLTTVQFWDLAHSSKTAADYTVAVTVGIDRQGRVYVLDVWRHRVAELVHATEDDARGLAAAMATHIAITKPHVVGVESNHFRQAAIRSIVSRVAALLRIKGVATTVRAVPVDRDKVVRATLPAQIAESGFMYADRDAAWFQALLAELSGFPNMVHDDQVDALAGAVQLALQGVDTAERATQGYGFATDPTGAAPEWDWHAEMQRAAAS